MILHLPHEQVEHSAAWPRAASHHAGGAPAPQLAPVARDLLRPFDGCARSLDFDFPFRLGVASGDPRPDSVVLWTRLAPEPLQPAGGMPARPVPVFWQIASDDRFQTIERFGGVLAVASDAHSVHVEVQGLSPYAVYWYRFQAGGYTSPVGCTRTLPGLRSHTEGLRFAFASEQNHPVGRSAVYRAMARDDLDFVLFAGNYAKGAGADDARPLGSVGTLLDRYRAHFARVRADRDLQAAQGAFPWISVLSEPCESRSSSVREARYGWTVAPLPLHRAAARKAYLEHMPLRTRGARAAQGRDPSALSLGPLAELHVHDVSDRSAGRSARSLAQSARDPEPCRSTTSCGVQWPAGLRAEVEQAIGRWRLVIESSQVTHDGGRSELARCYVRCELDRDSFRMDMLAPPASETSTAPLDERASLLLHKKHAQRCAVLTSRSHAR